jgi:hypothetical protein
MSSPPLKGAASSAKLTANIEELSQTLGVSQNLTAYYVRQVRIANLGKDYANTDRHHEFQDIPLWCKELS